MKRQIVLCLIAFLCLSTVSAQTKQSEAISNIIQRYPQATLQDIYKSFFQDRFGPGHLVGDTIAARKYLHNELETMKETTLPYFEPTGCGDNYVRVNLSLIKDSVLTESDFFDAFIESAHIIKLPPIEEWKEEWIKILDLVPHDIENFGQDKEMIDSLLNSGQYVVHHSKKFNQAYHPHYRIIEKNIFIKRLLPKINN